jgi:DNA-directed RNA polymerase specialized sigma24 family protein
MPGNDADFAAYLGARWPSLVRTLVLLGCGRPEAEDVARSGLARCYGSWDRVRRGDDVDVHVYAAVVRSLHQHRRRVPAPPVPAAPDAEEATEDELLLHVLVVELDGLVLDEREAVVLHYVAELSEEQVADVLDVPLESAQARITHGVGRLEVVRGSQDAFRRASESIEVSIAPVTDDVVAEARARRHRQVRLVVVGAVVAAAVLGGASWLANRESAADDGPLPPAAVIRVANPVRVAWYANNRLHLDQVAVEVPAVTDLVELNGGALYGDHQGRVVFVAADGQRRQIGDKSPDNALVASPSDGWAAWVDEGSKTQAPALVVYDVSNGRLLDTREVPSGDVRPIAIDQHQVFYTEPDGTFAWTPDVEPPLRIQREGLVDVESANRAYQVGDSIDMVQSFFNVSFLRRGTGALISPGGTLVLSGLPRAGLAGGETFTPVLYDARSGDRRATGVIRGEVAVDATFGRDNTVVYLVAQEADLAGGSDLDGNVDPLLVLRSCDLSSSRCTDLAPVPTGTGLPVLAH